MLRGGDGSRLHARRGSRWQARGACLPQFKWVDTVLGNFKTMLSAAHKSSGHSKHAARDLGAFAYRFNRRFDLTDLWRNSSCAWSWTSAVPTATPLRVIRQAEVHF